MVVRPRYHIPILVTVALLSWGAVVLPLSHDLSVLYRHWDGPMYIMVAKTLYRIPPENPLSERYKWPPKRFAPFLMMYPLAIRAVAPLLGYHWGMVGLAVFFATVAAVCFYALLRDSGVTDRPLWLAILFLFVPHRWLIYRSVGASEPMFLAFSLLSLWLFVRRKYVLSFVAAAVACDTRIQGLFLIPAYGLTILLDRDMGRGRKAALLLASAAVSSLLCLNMAIYHRVWGDFWAYLTINNTMVEFMPFGQLIDYVQDVHAWQGYFGSQHYLLLYGITLIGLARLWRIDRGRVLFVYSLFSFAFLTLILHEDLARYLIAVAPFTWLLGFQEVWTDRRILWVVPILLALVYAYAWNAIPLNVADAGPVNSLLQWRP